MKHNVLYEPFCSTAGGRCTGFTSVMQTLDLQRLSDESHAMPGWSIVVYKQSDGNGPATAESSGDTVVGMWLASVNGLKWLDELVKASKAIDLGGDGYPMRYTATAGNLLPRMLEKSPLPSSAQEDELGDNLIGPLNVDHAEAGSCRFDEWLLVMAWDRS